MASLYNTIYKGTSPLPLEISNIIGDYALEQYFPDDFYIILVDGVMDMVGLDYVPDDIIINLIPQINALLLPPRIIKSVVFRKIRYVPRIKRETWIKYLKMIENIEELLFVNLNIPRDLNVYISFPAFFEELYQEYIVHHRYFTTFLE